MYGLRSVTGKTEIVCHGVVAAGVSINGLSAIIIIIVAQNNNSNHHRGRREQHKQQTRAIPAQDGGRGKTSNFGSQLLLVRTASCCGRGKNAKNKAHLESCSRFISYIRVAHFGLCQCYILHCHLGGGAT